MYTNINLQDNTNQYIYVVEYKNQKHDSIISELKYSIVNDTIIFNDSISNICRNKNIWLENSANKVTEYMPSVYNTSIISLYFPQFSIETYKTGISYALTFNTWIHGKEIVLGTYIIRRSDAMAAKRIKTFYNDRYYECLEFEIINPWDLMYADEWLEFRKNVCGERQIDKYYALNSVGSILNITLHPVEKNFEKYIAIDECHGGQNSLNLSENDDAELKLNLSHNTNIRTLNEPSFICDLKFNDAYKQSLKDYLIETYNIDKFNISYELVIGNDNDIYGVYNSEIMSDNDNFIRYEFKKTQISPSFINGYGFSEGINVKASVNITDSNGNDIIYILSNSIPFNIELFKYFVGDSNPSNPAGFFIQCGYKINNVNLNDIDMNLYNINAVNKIEQKIVQINKPENTKSNIIKPIFFNTQPLSDIIIHPEVTETICINLDAYKAKVDTFIFQVEGCHFQEIGRTVSGVLFKIIGNKLPNQKTSGSYYILDQNSEMITSGKYTYIA